MADTFFYVITHKPRSFLEVYSAKTKDLQVKCSAYTFHCIDRGTLTLFLTLTLTLKQTLTLNLIMTLKFKIGGVQADIL